MGGWRRYASTKTCAPTTIIAEVPSEMSPLEKACSSWHLSKVLNFEFCLSICWYLNFEVKYCNWSLAQNLQHPNIFLFLFGQDLVSIL